MKAKQPKLTHIDRQHQPAMVDIGAKATTRRTATAQAQVVITREIAALMQGNDLQSAKGPVFQTAIIAGTQAVKETSRLIPFCHPLPLDKCNFTISLNGEIVSITCTVSAEYKTGVEMEALTGASIAALTVYDMCKAITHHMEIRSVRLVSKTGGKRTIGAPA